LFNSLGKKLYQSAQEHTGGKMELKISLDKKLPAGVYYLKLNDGKRKRGASILVE